MDHRYLSKDNQITATVMPIPKTDIPSDSSLLIGGLRVNGLGKASSPGKPLISVVIVTMNRAAVLGDAIASVVNQRYDNIELIVVDGASHDESIEIIKAYDHAIDYWVSEPDNGIYHAMNKAIDLATGDWLYFLGSDDVMFNCLHKVATYLTTHNTVYYGDVYLPTSHRLYAGEYTPYMLMKNNIPHQATFYPRQLFAKYRYNTDYISSADYYLNLICFNDAAFSYTYMPILVAAYEDTSGLSTLRLDRRFDNDFQRILKDSFASKIYYEYVLRTSLKKFERKFLRGIIKFFKAILPGRP